MADPLGGDEPSTADRETRRQALAAAKAKLEARRKARQELKAAREQRQRTQGNATNFGRQDVENFLKIMRETEKVHDQKVKDSVGGTEKKDDEKSGAAPPKRTRASKYRASGRCRVLEPSNYEVFTYKDERKVDTFEKDVGTDAIVFDDYLTNILSHEFTQEMLDDPKQKEKIYAEFVKSEEVTAWPPSNAHARSVSIGMWNM